MSPEWEEVVIFKSIHHSFSHLSRMRRSDYFKVYSSEFESFIQNEKDWFF